MVRMERLELSRLAAPEPKSGVYTNFTTSAQHFCPKCQVATQNRNNGVTEGDRTLDHRNHNPALYQLSYSHHKYYLLNQRLVRPTGIEPVTLGLEGRCSIRLSYGRFIYLNKLDVRDKLSFVTQCSSAHQVGRIIRMSTQLVNTFF